MVDTPPLEPDPVIIPGRDPAEPFAPDEAPTEPSPDIGPDFPPLEQPDGAPFPDDESGRPVA